MNNMLQTSLIVWGCLIVILVLVYMNYCYESFWLEFEHLEWWEVPGVLLLRGLMVGVVGFLVYTLTYPIIYLLKGE